MNFVSFLFLHILGNRTESTRKNQPASVRTPGWWSEGWRASGGRTRALRSSARTDLGWEQAWAANRAINRTGWAVGWIRTRRQKKRPCPIFSGGGGRAEKWGSPVELNVGFPFEKWCTYKLMGSWGIFFPWLIGLWWFSTLASAPTIFVAKHRPIFFFWTQEKYFWKFGMRN